MVNNPDMGFHFSQTKGLTMKFIRHFALAAIAAASFSAMAATDGVADATQSVGTFTNTFGNTSPVQLRVFGLQDALMVAGAGSVASAYGNFPGVADRFCVAHSTGASVTIRFTSPGITAKSGAILIATDAASGGTLGYHMSVGTDSTPANLTDVGQVDSYIVAAPQTSLTDCSNPNVYKSIIRAQGLDGPAVGTFTDLVTVTATLN